jgi:hypothetical protein
MKNRHNISTSDLEKCEAETYYIYHYHGSRRHNGSGISGYEAMSMYIQKFIVNCIHTEDESTTNVPQLDVFHMGILEHNRLE